jgi:hypothetical protein
MSSSVWGFAREVSDATEPNNLKVAEENKK